MSDRRGSELPFFIDRLLEPWDVRDLRLINKRLQAIAHERRVLLKLRHYIHQRAKWQHEINKGWRCHPATRLPPPQQQQQENENG